MGRVKTLEERMAKRLKAKADAKLMQQEQSERDETKRPEKIIRRPAQQPDVVNFGSQSLRQKKG